MTALTRASPTIWLLPVARPTTVWASGGSVVGQFELSGLVHRDLERHLVGGGAVQCDRGGVDREDGGTRRPGADLRDLDVAAARRSGRACRVGGAGGPRGSSRADEGCGVPWSSSGRRRWRAGPLWTLRGTTGRPGSGGCAPRRVDSPGRTAVWASAATRPSAAGTASSCMRTSTGGAWPTRSPSAPATSVRTGVGSSSPTHSSRSPTSHRRSPRTGGGTGASTCPGHPDPSDRRRTRAARGADVGRVQERRRGRAPPAGRPTVGPCA